MNDTKYATGQEAVEALRRLASFAALDYIRPLVRAGNHWRQKRPITQTRLAARLNTICACIAALNDSTCKIERDAAITRAQGMEQ